MALPEAVVTGLQDLVEADPEAQITVDLVQRQVSAPNLVTDFDIDDYEISYTVPRHVSQPLPLTSATSYAHLIANATKGKTPTLSAKLTVIQKATQVRKQIDLWIYFSNYEHFRTTKTRRITEDSMPKIQRTRRKPAM